MHNGHDEGGGHGLMADASENVALLDYMLSHNRHHAEELHEIAHDLEAAEKTEAAAQLYAALQYFEQGNEWLEAALAQLKKEA